MVSTLLLAASLWVNGNFDSPKACDKWILPKCWRIVADEGCNGTQACAAVRTLLGGGSFRPDGEKLHVEFPPCGYAFVEWRVK